MFTGEEAKVEPFAEFGPSFSFKLSFGVGGDDSASIREGAERPHGNLRDGCGFGDAVARCNGFLDGGVGVDQAIANSVHEFAGPFLRAIGGFKHSPGLAPRIRAHGEGKGIAFGQSQEMEKLVVHQAITPIRSR